MRAILARRLQRAGVLIARAPRPATAGGVGSSIQAYLETLHARHAGLRDGEVATYIEDRGRETVLAKVGVEPSGEAFNSISLPPARGER